jgi:8-oxo-dGTP pyrophosphatase MutT (NUDIX family)
LTHLLRPGEAVSALMVTADSRYLLQHRDDRPDIFFPNYWGNFGGAVERGETKEEALRREIREELEFEVKQFEYFGTLDMDFRFAALGIIPRHYFVVPIAADDVPSMRLREGRDKALFDGDKILKMPMVAPYDALAIWQHLARGRFAPYLHV